MARAFEAAYIRDAAIVKTLRKRYTPVPCFCFRRGAGWECPVSFKTIEKKNWALTWTDRLWDVCGVEDI